MEPSLSDKWYDPAVVVVTPDLRYASPQRKCLHLTPSGAWYQIGDLNGDGNEGTAFSGENRSNARFRCRGPGPSASEVNGVVFGGDVPIVPVDPPHIVVANPGVLVVVNDSPYVIGVGCRLGTTAEEMVSAIDAAM